MKKIAFLIVSCCLLLCTSCRKDDFTTNRYKASIEYHIEDADDAAIVERLMNNWDNIWQSEIELTLLNTSTTDAEAYTKFEASIVAIDAKINSWEEFLDDDDYFLYKLERTTPSKEASLRTVKFDKSGHIVL